jgi:hypothetical protein
MTTPGRPFADQDPRLADREGGPDLAALPSRRRSRESQLAVLRATVDLLNEVGYRRLSFEGVARRAGWDGWAALLGMRGGPSGERVDMSALWRPVELPKGRAGHGSYRASARRSLWTARCWRRYGPRCAARSLLPGTLCAPATPAPAGHRPAEDRLHS